MKEKRIIPLCDHCEHGITARGRRKFIELEDDTKAKTRYVVMRYCGIFSKELDMHVTDCTGYREKK